MYIGPFSFSTTRKRGGGGRWTSLHESTSVCPPLLISSHLISSHLSPMHRLYHLHILHYHFSLCTFQTHTHTHTHKHKTTIWHYPSSQAQEHYIFFALSTPAAQDHFSLFTFLLDTDTVKIMALCYKITDLMSTPDQRWTVHFTWSPGAAKLPTAPGGSLRKDGPGWVKGRSFISQRPQACVCLCVLCRLHKIHV